MFVSESRRWHTLIAFGAFIIAMPYFGATVVPSVSVPVTSELESHGGRLGSLPQLAAPADPPVVRTDFSKLGPGAVAALRKGIAEMMKLDVGKPDNMLSPLGWKYQASIHGSLPGAMKQPAWDTCQHSSWFFLSWHRMELYFFERILRAMSGDPKLTLPYWNFSVPPAGMDPTKFGARLPAAFRVKPTVAAPNSLWWEFRDAGVNKPPGPGAMDTATPLSHDDVATLKAFSQAAFFSNTKAMGMMSFGGGALPKDFHDAGAAGGGQIERIPHNQIHGAVGLGDKDPNFGLSLGDPDGAGLDPIFWPFHANIDRAWSCWQEKHPGTEPKSEIWMKTQKFLFFDVMKKDDGSLTAVRVMMSGEQVLDTAKQLGYTYDNNCQNFELPPAPKAEELTTSVLTGAPREPLSVAAESHTTLAAEPVSVIIQITAEMQSRIDALVLAGAPPGSIVLTVGGLAVDRPTAASYGIYLDLPEGQVPNHGNGHYADELSFFGMGHHRHEDAHGGAMAPQDNAWNFDISDLVQSLADKGKWVRDQVTVTFANIAAGEPDRAAPPPASPDVRARFAYLKITVE